MKSYSKTNSRYNEVNTSSYSLLTDNAYVSVYYKVEGYWYQIGARHLEMLETNFYIKKFLENI